ncbi:MAG TPA: CcmD family protein [Bacteroidales bacterium]|nr:CcmD family protein [Bacteroidales bacterium]HQI45452.1 CcmD family protein [Bacteroidales bacterium]
MILKDIHIVVIVLLVIFAGIVLYLSILDRKITKLEKKVNSLDEEKK